MMVFCDRTSHANSPTQAGEDQLANLFEEIGMNVSKLILVCLLRRCSCAEISPRGSYLSDVVRQSQLTYGSDFARFQGYPWISAGTMPIFLFLMIIPTFAVRVSRPMNRGE
jgi:hypothetical protein